MPALVRTIALCATLAAPGTQQRGTRCSCDRPCPETDAGATVMLAPVEPEHDPGTRPAGDVEGTEPRPRRGRLRLVVTLAAVLAGPLLAEVWLRHMIFRASEPGDEVRDARRYADPSSDDDYYKLQHVLADPSSRRPIPIFDPIMGWLGDVIEPGTYTHRNEASLAERRPVLMYGASYARCVARTACFQQILEESELADRYAMLNYAIGNAGFDQMVLMLQHSIDHYAGRNPVVVIGAVLDTDFDRCMVSFRGWPKPHFSLTDDGGVRWDGPVIEGADAFIEQHPIGIRSYLWSSLVHGEWLPRSWRDTLSGRDEKQALKKELVSGLVTMLQGELEGRDLDHFFVLFSSAYAADPEAPVTWQEEFVTGLFDERGVPYILVRKLLIEQAAKDGRDTDDYYFHEGIAENHLTEEGNRIAFEAVRRGLDGNFDGGSSEP